MAHLRNTAKRLREDGSNGLTTQLCVDLYYALKDLYEISGEATIPLVNSHAVRKMAKFVAARKRAAHEIEKCER